MMADTTFVPSSLWPSDCLLPRLGMADALPLFDLDTLDTLPSSGSVSEREDSYGTLLSDWGNDGLSSVASSECSEQSSEHSLGLLPPTDHSDFMSSLLSSVFEDQSVNGIDLSLLDAVIPPSADDLNPLDFDKDDEESSDWMVLPVKSRKRSLSQCLNLNTTWSRLSGEEQVELVEHITNFITHNMGLREQLDIISLISPRANLAPTDTQFVIDLDCFDDDKLRKVCNYISNYQHSFESCHGDVTGEDCGCGTYSSNTCGSSHRCRRGSQHSTTEASSSDEGSSECSTPTTKIHTKVGRRAVVRERRRQQRKEQRQQQKEKRSGLFKAEQVLALSKLDPGEPDDVDILT